MLHPIVSTVLGHPELVAEHLANYGALVREETQQASEGLVSKAIAGVLAAVAGMLALALIGVAVMLGVLYGRFHWVLAAVPGVAIAVAIVSMLVAARPRPFHAFAELRSQLDADVRALRVAGERHGR